MNKLMEGFNMDALTVEYIITKDYKFEEMRTAIKLSERNTDKNLVRIKKNWIQL